MKTLDIQYRQAQSVNIDLGMLDIATKLAAFGTSSKQLMT
jgi:hypothetical protein